MIEFNKGLPGQMKMTCSECGKQDLLLNWMSADMWNESVSEFKKKHEKCVPELSNFPKVSSSVEICKEVWHMGKEKFVVR